MQRGQLDCFGSNLFAKANEKVLTLLQRIRHAVHHFPMFCVIPDARFLLRCEPGAIRQGGLQLSVRGGR